LLAIPIAWIVAVSVIDVLSPPDIHLGPLLVAAPAITPSFGGPRTVGLVAAPAVIAQTTIGVLRDPDELLSANHQAQIIALVLVGTSLVIFCVLRERRAPHLRWAWANWRLRDTTSTVSSSSRETFCCCTRTASPRPETPPAPSTRSPSASQAGPRTTPTPSSAASGATCCTTSADT
jgi:hypothetical protein